MASRISYDFEVNLATSPKNNISPSDYDFTVSGNTIDVTVPVGGNDLNPDGSPVTVVSYNLALTADNSNVISDLCLLNVSEFVSPTPAGTSDLAVIRDGFWFIDTDLDGTADIEVPFGLPSDTPLVGNFN